MADLVLGALGAQPSIGTCHSQIVETLSELEQGASSDVDLLVPLALWLTPEAATWVKAERRLVLLRAADDALLLDGRLDGVKGIAVEFANFNDGRGYSQAYLLRRRLGYQGQLRAVGDVLRDQLFYLLRCGFDAFEPRADRSSADFILAYRDFSAVYQASATSRPLFAERGGPSAAKLI